MHAVRPREPLDLRGAPPAAASGEATAFMSTEQALRQALEEVSPAVYRVLCRMGVTSFEVDDSMQTVLLQLANRWDDLGRVTGPELYAYACTVASGVAIDVARRRGRQRARSAALESETALESEATRDERALEGMLDYKRELELLDRILQTLPDERREVFVLFELEELTVPEIAERLAIPVGTVSSRLRKAREEFLRSATRVRKAEERRRGPR